MARLVLPFCLLLALVAASTAFSMLEVDKPGECPPTPKMMCMMMNPPNRCHDDDSNCPGDQKCCPGVCGKSCTKPRGISHTNLENVKPGKCPAVWKQCRRANPPDRCESNDSNCPGDEKCCTGSCGKECTKPEKKQKSGKCPLVRKQCRRLRKRDRCESDDFNCPGDKKCCSGFCGKVCRKPVTKKGKWWWLRQARRKARRQGRRHAKGGKRSNRN